jgi:DnaJ-class molecular chaperone
VNVTVPTKLSKRQRELLESFATESGEVVEHDNGLLERVRDALG